MQGFPSIGDVQSTVPVPKEKWFEYAGERSGRFQVCSNVCSAQVTLQQRCPHVRKSELHMTCCLDASGHKWCAAALWVCGKIWSGITYC